MRLDVSLRLLRKAKVLGLCPEQIARVLSLSRDILDAIREGKSRGDTEKILK